MTLLAILTILVGTTIFNSPVAAKPASSGPDPSNHCVAPPPDMVAWYPFDELSGATAAEIINSNDGTHVNGPTPFAGMKVANSLAFDGHNDYVEVPDAPELNFGAHQNFSIDFWINTTQVQRGAQVILDKRTWSPLRGYSVYLHMGKVGLQLADSSGYSNYTGNSAAFVADGKWHMVAITVNRENPFGQMYVDGTPVYSFTPNRNGSLANSSSLYFGDSPYTYGNRPLDGTLDEVEIFDRLLTHAEIDAIYNAGSAGKCKKDPKSGEFDLGDAPDSTNHHNVKMMAYLGSVMAKFPTVFDDNIPGPLHHQPREKAWLGERVSLEKEADIGPDEDPTNNLIPHKGPNNTIIPPNKHDLDEFDDGVRLETIQLPECGESRFEYDVNVVSGIEKWYFNAWFDFNRDGDWDDRFECESPQGVQTVYEWAVQDQVITLGPGYHTLVTPSFISGNSEKYEKLGLWMRTTLSERPAQAPYDGRGPEEGFKFGETEDYYLK